MTIKFMRWCDRWLGKSAAFGVWLLSPLLHRGLKNFPPPSGGPIPDVQRIVIIKFFGMGSLLLATPAFRSLKEAYPNAVLEIITSAGHRSFIETLGIFDRIHSISLAGPGKFFAGILKLLSGKGPTISINLEYYTWFTLALQTLQRSRVRVGFAERQWLRLRLLDVPIYFNYHHHIVRIFAAVAEQLGAPVSSLTLSPVSVRPETGNQVKNKLRQAGFDFKTPLIALHIGVSHLCRLRQWPLEHFRRLTLLLLEKTPVSIVLIGGRDEEEEARRFVAGLPASPRLLNWVGQLSIRESMALLEQSALLITSDSGPLHWAIALDTPTVSFFGPETPNLYGPPPLPRHKVFYTRRYCSPCMTTIYAKTSSCRNNLCLQDIGVDEVFEAVRELLDGKESAH